MSYPETYKSVATGVDLLNTVAPILRQVRFILPDIVSTKKIPVTTRKSLDSRRNHPLKCLNSPTLPSASTALRASTVSENNNVTASAARTTRATTTSSSTPVPDSVASSSIDPSSNIGVVSAISSASNSLDDMLQVLDEFGIYGIPGKTTCSCNAEFKEMHLQKCGIINDGNLCALIAMVFCCHRMQLVKIIDLDPSLMAVGEIDYQSHILVKVLSAMPSARPFSLELMKEVWNKYRYQSFGNYKIENNDDVWSCAEGILQELRFVNIYKQLTRIKSEQ